MTNTMQAAAVTGAGGPEVLRLVTMERPEPRPGEALVRLTYASVNAADLWTRRPGIVTQYPHVPGSDGVGVLVSANGNCAIDIGAEVLLSPALCSFDPAVAGDRPYGEIVRILGYDTLGTYAEFTTVPIQNVFAKPEHLSAEEAAAVPLTFLTAWRMLRSRAQLSPAETVLIWGASGGLGCAALALAKLHGATVIAMAGNDADARELAASGADVVVRYDAPAAADEIRARTAGRGVDVVFDSVAGPTWKTTLSVLRPGGRIVIAGTTGGDVVTHDLSDVFYYQWAVYGCRMGDNQEFGQMLRAISTRQIRPKIAAVFALADAANAHAKMERGEFVGKLVLRIESPRDAV